MVLGGGVKSGFFKHDYERMLVKGVGDGKKILLGEIQGHFYYSVIIFVICVVNCILMANYSG